MTRAEQAPIHRRHVVSTDVDEAAAVMRTRYGDHQPSFWGDRRAFEFRLDSTSVESAAGWFHVDRFQHRIGLYAPTDPAPDLLLTVPLGGYLRHSAGRETTTSVSLVPYWMPCVTDWDFPDVAVGVLDLDGVRRVGAELTGLEPAAVRFTGWRPLSTSWGEVVASTLGHLRGQMLAAREIVGSALIRSEAFRHLASTLLAAFPNTTHDVVTSGRDTGEPATVRRAMEFVDAHVHEDLDVTRIAEAARIGPRGLQAAFRRHRGQSPTDYLRQARLEGAHRDLSDGDPTRGDTVAEIAARWGFRHPGRFAVSYREAYGRPPGRTLKE